MANDATPSPGATPRAVPNLGQRRAGCGCCVVLDKVSLVQWLAALANDLKSHANISTRPGQHADLEAMADEVARLEGSIDGLCLNADCGQSRGHSGVCD